MSTTAEVLRNLRREASDTLLDLAEEVERLDDEEVATVSFSFTRQADPAVDARALRSFAVLVEEDRPGLGRVIWAFVCQLRALRAELKENERRLLSEKRHLDRQERRLDRLEGQP